MDSIEYETVQNNDDLHTIIRNQDRFGNREAGFIIDSSDDIIYYVSRRTEGSIQTDEGLKQIPYSVKKVATKDMIDVDVQYTNKTNVDENNETHGIEGMTEWYLEGEGLDLLFERNLRVENVKASGSEIIVKLYEEYEVGYHEVILTNFCENNQELVAQMV